MVASGAEEIKKQEMLVIFSTVSYKNRLDVHNLKYFSILTEMK